MIIQMAQQGRIGGKLDDTQLVSLLETITQQMPRSTSKVNYPLNPFVKVYINFLYILKVNFDRRRAVLVSWK